MDPRFLQWLSDPAHYPGRPEAVALRQTHLSVVALAGGSAFKFKKPVRFSFVDFSTVERRRHFCGEEVRLNRRLCPDVYLGVVPVYRTADGGWSFAEGAEIADYAVHMRRLPEERLLHLLLERETVGPEAAESLAGTVARFHAGADRGPAVLEAGSPERLAEFARANFEETTPERGSGLPGGLHAAAAGASEAAFRRILPRMRERAGRGLVVDGHGDLHCRNICLLDPPVIFDCIEFERAFRCGDTATENAFLAMDLTYRGHPELAAAYLNAYRERSGDEGQRALLPALVSYRAMVRAKVSCLAAAEEEIGAADRAEARESASRHLLLAAASLVADRGPVLVAFSGLPGSGTSTVAGELARRAGWPLLSSDRIRKELAGAEAAGRLPPRAYLPEFSARTYGELLGRAAEKLREGPVLADANFRGAAQRAEALSAARRAGAACAFVLVETEEEEVLRRLRAREQEGTALSDAGPAVYARLRAEFRPPEPGEGFEVVRVDGARAPDRLAGEILEALLQAPAPRRRDS